MKIYALALSALLIGTAGTGFAQSQHDAHGAGTAQQESGSAGDQPASSMMMENMPEQCRAAMRNLPDNCMAAMEGMMQGGMMHGDQSADSAAAATESRSEARQAYEVAMDAMHGPMMEGIAEEDPDVAFVRGMIPHHQGAIDMAKIVQQYGDDEETKNWAARIIEAQEGEIAEMQEWLEKNAR